jgi:hypothetical protein
MPNGKERNSVTNEAIECGPSARRGSLIADLDIG